MKKSVKILGISVGVVVGLAVIASVAVSLIADPAKYKPQIEMAFNEATGYKLSINGDIGVSLFPLPKAYVQDVAVTNGSKQLVEVKQINIYPEILPLLSGQKKISSIKVKSPNITLEKGETGANWATTEPQEEKPKSAKTNLSIDSIEIEDGKLQYADHISGKNHVLDKIELEASLASVDGPLNLTGDVEYNGLPVTLKTSINNFTDPKVFADLEAKETKIKYDGTKTGGKLILTSKDISPILSAAGMNNKMLAGRAVSFDGDVKYEDQVITIINSKFAFGDSSGNVDLAAQLGEEEIAATINLAINKLNLDELLTANKESSATKADAPVEKKNPAKIRAEVTATANEIIYKASTYRKLNTTLSMDGDVVTIRPFSIQTPGQGSVETYGVLTKTSRGWDYDGNLNSSASNMREFVMAITGNKLEKVNPKGLKKFDMQSNITATISDVSTVNLSNLKMALDSSNIQGALTVKTSKPTDISFKGTIDNINVDNYIVKNQQKDEGTSGGLKGNKKVDFGWLKNLPVSADINASVGNLTYNNKKYENIRLNGTARPGDIDFKEFSGNLQMFSIGAILSLNVEGARPRFNVDANIDNLKLTDITNTDKQAETAAGKTGGQWSEKVFNFSPLDQMDGNIKANIGAITGNKIVFRNATLVGRLNNGVATLDNFYGNVFGGNINMNGELSISAVPSIKFNLSADDVDVAEASQALITTWPISGRASVNGSFTSAGVHQKAMINNLNGSTSISATNISIRGLDLASFGYNLLNTNDPLAIVAVLKNVSGQSKSSQMSSVGTIFAEKGILKTTGLQVQSDAAQGVVVGNLDLNRWYMDGDAKFNMAVAGSDKKSPVLGVHLYGAPDALKKEYDTKEIEKYVAEKGILSQNKIDLLKPGGIENKINEKLMKQLGITKPGATAPATTAPATAPATTAPATTNPAPSATAPATEPATTTTTPAPAEATTQPMTEKEKRREQQKQLINQGIQQLFGGNR